MNYIVKRKRRNDFGVKGMKKGVRKAVQKVSNSAVGNAVKTIGKNYKRAFHNNVGLAKRMLKQKNIGHKLTGAYLAATTPIAIALGGTALNLKSGYKGAKKMITGKDSAFKDSLVVMAYRKRQLRDALLAYRDAEEETRSSKIQVLSQKIKNEINDIKTKNPKLVAALKKSLSIIGKIISTLSALVSVSSVYNATQYYKDLKRIKVMNDSLEDLNIKIQARNWANEMGQETAKKLLTIANNEAEREYAQKKFNLYNGRPEIMTVSAENEKPYKLRVITALIRAFVAAVGSFISWKLSQIK